MCFLDLRDLEIRRLAIKVEDVNVQEEQHLDAGLDYRLFMAASHPLVLKMNHLLYTTDITAVMAL
jgi:hypothetical protein